MSAPRPVWVVVVRDPQGALVPVAVSSSEDQAYEIGAEASDALSLGIAYGAQPDEVKTRNDIIQSMEVRRAWLLIEGED